MTRATLLCFLILGACARGGRDERVSDGALRTTTAPGPTSGTAVPAVAIDAAAPPAAAPDAGGPAAPATTCADLSAAFQQRLAAATGTCASAADCGCFTSIVDQPPCSGVTDAASARALNELAARFGKAGCRLPRQCGPGSCAPTCVDRRCQ